MFDVVIFFAIWLLVALVVYSVGGIARRHAARLDRSEREDTEVYEKSANAAWRELDRQRTRSDIGQQHWR